MELRNLTTPTLEKLRAEVREFIDSEYPPELEGFQWDFEEDPDRWAQMRVWWKKLGAKRWLWPHWPTEYGGAGMGPLQAKVVQEELDRRRVGGYGGIGMMVGPAIMRLGTEEQKAFFCPGMAAGEIMWAEGYTEPNSGSDLASLRTRAELDGDEWVINGQKTFCTAGHWCNWMIIAARTHPDYEMRHKGITYFLSPMDVPGMELTPLYNYADGRQNVVYLDNLRVPAKWQLGGLRQGWFQIWFGMGGNPLPQFADDGIDGPEGLRDPYDPPPTEYEWVLQQLTQYCRETVRNGKPMSEDPVVRDALAELAIHLEIEKVIRIEGGRQYGSHLNQAITKEFQPVFGQKCMEILGPLGIIQTGKWAPLAGEIDRIYRRSFGNHAGGTSQLKRMVVATRVLGLPR